MCLTYAGMARRGLHMMLLSGAARLPGIGLEFCGVAVPVRKSARHLLYLAVPWVRDSACVQARHLKNGGLNLFISERRAPAMFFIILKLDIMVSFYTS
jgi:hypothetical protein